jgi:hypothetical protein
VFDELRELESKVFNYEHKGFFYTVPPGVKVTLRLGEDSLVREIILESEED